MTWRELVRPDEVAGVTVAGSDAVRWAVDVHERFFGDAWLLRADTSDNRIATIVSGPLTGVVPNTSTTTGLVADRAGCNVLMGSAAGSAPGVGTAERRRGRLLRGHP